jgi:hypothetical protein
MLADGSAAGQTDRVPTAGPDDENRARAMVAARLGSPVAADEPFVVRRAPARPTAGEVVTLVVPSLARCWWVATAEAPVPRRIRSHLPRAVRTLEEHDLERYDPWRDRWLRDMPTLADALVRLDDLDVVHAEALPSPETPRTLLATGLGGSSTDEDPDAVVAGLVVPPSSGRRGGHLVVLADDPLLADVVPRRDRWDRTQPAILPRRDPAPGDGWDHVWLVHDATGRGWHWDGEGWEPLAGSQGAGQ